MEDFKKLTTEAKLYTKRLRIGLPTRTDPAKVSTTAKIPYKALNAVVALLYRAADLAEASCDLIETENLISAACTVRAFQETLAIIIYVHMEVEKGIKNKNAKHLDESLMKILLAAKNISKAPDPVHILKIIDLISKERPGFRVIYDSLSELVHPNWAGTLGIYSKSNKDKKWTDFGRNINQKDITKNNLLVFSHHSGLKLLAHVVDNDAFAKLLIELTEICEGSIKTKP